MGKSIHVTATISMTELKRNPIGAIETGNGATVAIMNRNKVVFYCVPAKEYEAMLDRIDDAEMNALAESRGKGREIITNLDDL